MTGSGGAPMSPALKAVIDQVWPDLGGAVRVSSDPRPAAGFIAAERYLAVPSLRRARFIVPLTTRAAAVSSVVSYNRLRAPATRLSRRGVGLAVATGAGRLTGERFHVHVRGGGFRQDQLLSARLAELFEVERVGVGVGVRPAGPNSKPTLVCLADDGRPLGFAKVGWNDLTAAMVATEALALRRAAGEGLPLVVPRVHFEGRWQERQLCVTEPLPPDVRRWGPSRPAPDVEVTLAVAGTGTTSRQRLAGSEQLRLLRSRAAAGWDASIRRSYLELVARLESSRAAAGEMRFGAWHGDWTPWNLGHSRQHGLAAWDWEHYRDGVLTGLDLVNWHFRVALNIGGEPVGGALQHALRQAEPMLRELDRAAGFPALVTGVFALELTARYEEMAVAGVGRSAPIDTGLADALATVTGWIDGPVTT